MTLQEFVNTKNSDLGEPFSALINVVEQTAKSLHIKLSESGLIAESGDSGKTNVYGENVQKLDAFADETFTSSLLSCPAVYAVGSEELAEPKFSQNKNGLYNITHDPLDGSSNIDINLPVGTIFGVYPKKNTMLQKGSSLIAGGYVLYGPSMMIVYATKGSVNGFTFDARTNQFLLSYPDIKIGNKKIYSLNEGNWELFSQADKNYLTSIKKEGTYSLRYVGAMVGDLHRTLLKGGIFLYPEDSKHPDGKLRLLYEVAPLSFLIIQAGGSAVSRGQNPLDILPVKHDARVPIVLGSTAEVNKYSSFTPSR
ncbi:fructose-1,6-bisphosphatase [Candidatus Gottesmanbacteria bacterium]|nr:fructose-1,6-bisphosphatase [Candidatus Gottesmanbacteria bacterium]